MKGLYVYKPFKFFMITFLLTWTTWFLSAFLSHREGMEALEGTLMGLGLLGPLAVALFMVFGSKSNELKRDFTNKLINCKLVKPVYLPAIFLLMPIVMVVSILLSVIAGQSMEQLGLSSEFDIMSGHPIISLIIPLLAPALEELGWSGYGIDSLRNKFNMLTATLLFAVIWSLWHLPLFFIEGYYHYNLLQTNIIYAVNFFISVIPLTIITNWLYFKNNRSIIAAIVFHAIVVVSAEIFMVTGFTKCIVTVVLAVIATTVVVMDKEFFFDHKNAFDSKSSGLGMNRLLGVKGAADGICPK